MELAIDSDGEENMEFVFRSIKAFEGTFFEYKLEGSSFKLPRVLKDRYILYKEIDKGCFGSVFDLYDTVKKQMLAVKLCTVSSVLK